MFWETTSSGALWWALDSKLVCMLTHCGMIESREPKVHIVKQNENTHVSYINGAMEEGLRRFESPVASHPAKQGTHKSATKHGNFSGAMEECLRRFESPVVSQTAKQRASISQLPNMATPTGRWTFT